MEKIIDRDVLEAVTVLLRDIANISFPQEQYQIRNAMVGELLTKYIVAVPLEEGMQFPLPCFNRALEPVCISYAIQCRFFLGNSGIPVYILQPAPEYDAEGCCPIVVFRGTKFSLDCKSDIRSIVENLNKEGAARGLYNEFRKTLGRYMKAKCAGENGTAPRFRVMGYSQGGVLAQRAVVDFYEYVAREPLHLSLFFNSPALEDDYFNRWLEIPETSRPSCFNILRTGDPVSKRGHKFIGNVYEVEPLQKEGLLQAHLGAKTITTTLRIYEVHNDKEALHETRKLINELMASALVEGLYNVLSKGLSRLQSRSQQLEKDAKSHSFKAY